MDTTHSTHHTSNSHKPHHDSHAHRIEKKEQDSEKSEQVEETKTLALQDKDTLPMLVGVGMLLAVGVGSYSFGYSSGATTVNAQLTQEQEQQNIQAAQAEREKQEEIMANITPAQAAPGEWKTYDNLFGSIYFSFRYPQTHEALDFDQRRGQLYVARTGDTEYPQDVIIDSLNRTFFFQDYQSGPMTDWFRTNIQAVYPDTDFSSMKLEEVTIAQNGQEKKFLKAESWPESIQQINPNLFGGEWYIGIENNIPYYAVNNNKMSQEDFQTLLYSISVNTERLQ